MSLHSETRKHHQKHAERMVRRAKGGRVHSDEAEDKALIKKELRKAKIVAKKAGGSVRGKPPAERLDKRARGGRMGGKKHAGVKIVVHAGGGGGNPMAAQAAHQAGMQQGVALGARMASARPAGPPPGAPPGMPPMGAMAPRPPMPMANGPMPPGLAPRPPGLARGGKVKMAESRNEKFGAGSGMGRAAKEGVAPALAKGGVVKVKEHVRRKRGGALC